MTNFPHFTLQRLAGLLLVCSLSGCAERGIEPPHIVSLDQRSTVISKSTNAPRDPSSPLQVRLATANLWGVSVLGMDVAEEIDVRFAEFADRLGRNESQLDLVLIQEAWKDSARHALLSHPGVVENFPHRVDAVDRPGGAGLVILSRFPIEEARFHRFRAQGRCLKFWEGDCLSGKGVLAIRVEIEGHDLWIGDTHFIACYMDKGLSETTCDQIDPNGDTRFSQLLETRRFVEDLAGDGPALLGGDFNLTRSSRYYPFMTDAEIYSDEEEVVVNNISGGHPRGWSETGEAVITAGRIDYLWSRKGRTESWEPLGNAELLFTRPVLLPDGRSIEISDHPIIANTFGLTDLYDR